MNVKPEFLKPGLFRDRREAGRLLAAKLTAYANRPDVIVLALPRGGVPVADEVARALGAPLDVFVVCASWAFPAPRSWRWAPDRRRARARSTISW